MGGSSGQAAMVIAVLWAVLGFRNLFEGIDRGRIMDYILSVIPISLAACFALEWYRYWRGYYTMVFDSEAYQIRKRGAVTTTGRFDDLKEITQDGRGYTLTQKDGSQYRVLRKVMDSELVHTLDSIQQKQDTSCEATGDHVSR
jgi:hypothetical protein